MKEISEQTYDCSTLTLWQVGSRPLPSSREAGRETSAGDYAGSRKGQEEVGVRKPHLRFFSQTPQLRE